MSSFSEQRGAIQAKSQEAIAAAQNSDRQARSRARSQVKERQADFDELPEDEQEQLLVDAEFLAMKRRQDKGIDAETKTAKILDEEVAQLEAIKKEEDERRLKLLGADSNSKKRKRESDDEEDESDKIEESEVIQEAFKKRMTPIIEKWERQIIAGGDMVAPGVSEEELDSFTKNASNPANVREYLEKWDKEDADINEGLDGEEFAFGDDDLEVVITDDEDYAEGESDEDLADFIEDEEEFKIEDEEEDEEEDKDEEEL